MNCATRGSRHARRKLAQTSVSGCRLKSPQMNGSALMSLTSPLGSTIKQRGRVLQAVAQLFEQPRLVEVDAHAAAILQRLLPQRVEERLVIGVRQLQMPPGLDRVAGVHRAPRIEAVRAELVGEIDGGADLVRIERRRREVDLQRNLRRAQVAQALDRLVEAAAHAHPLERRRRRAVEAHLHGLDAELPHPRAIRGGEIVAIGLDLELRAARAHALDHVEEPRVQHRLAAREGQVRDLVVHQLVDDGEHLLGAELVGERLARTALLDAVEAREVALVRDLPRDIERRGQVLRLGRRREACRPGRPGGRVRCEIGHAVSPRGARVPASRR